jgi:catechol 2,3-dioxygenase
MSQSELQQANILPAELRMGPVTLRVAGLARAVDFYSRVLGLKVLERTTEAASLGAGGQPLMRLEAQPGGQPQPEFSTGLYHVAIRLPSRPDLGRVLLNMARANYPASGFSDHLVSEAVYLNDPDGNGLELYRDRPRAEWPRLDGQIRMATDPLDVEGIIASVPDPDAPFTGMPDGTDIGHVHLRAGDITLAEKFYHDVLGFDVIIKMPSALFVSAGGYHHHLGLNTWQSRNAPPPPANSVGLAEYTIFVPSAEALDPIAQRLDDAAHPYQRADGAIRVDDPWGNHIRIAAEK